MMANPCLPKFDEDFLRELRHTRKYPDAFDIINKRWQDEHGFTPFESYDSFRMQKQRKRKRK